MNESNTKGQSVAELFARYLERQVAAHSEGLGYPDLGDQVTPFESAPVQPADPQLAWKDALEAVRLLMPGQKLAFKVPPEWPMLVNQQEPAVALAFSLGNYPQMVRNVHPLLTGEPVALRQGSNTPLVIPGLLAWTETVSDDAGRLLAAGVLRLVRHHDRAEALLAGAGPGWETVVQNERASLAWQRGDSAKALGIWDSLPDSAVSRFNRGMARLFLGENRAAAAELTAAVAALPDTSAWHHLASLYLTMAER